MSDKMMEFDEWCKKHDMNQDSALVVAMFHDARSGMIPAENAVVIPPMSEWPEGANGISVLFVSEDHVKTGCAIWESFPGESEEAMIQFIPRPKPVWTPKVGEAVFTNSAIDGEMFIGKAVGMDDEMFKVLFPKGDTGTYDLFHLKPFHPDHIGKPWDEIPGGVE